MRPPARRHDADPAIPFTAPLRRQAQLRFVDVPPDAADMLGVGARIPVIAEVAGMRFPSTLVPASGGGKRLFVPMAVCRALGADVGDRVPVSLRLPGKADREELPADLLVALRSNPEALEELVRHPPSDRRQLAKWLDAAKSPETRRRRVESAVGRVLASARKRSERSRRAGSRPAVSVRPATPADAAAIATLSGELGYPIDAAAAKRRLSALRVGGEAELFVAEAGATVAGWLEVGRSSTIESGERGEIRGLVVAAGARRSGVGRALVAAAEEWCRSRALPKLRVRTNVRRDDAAAFYRAFGFTESKVQRVFDLPLAAAPRPTRR